MAPSLHGLGQMTSIKLRPGRLTNTVKRIAGRRLGTLLPRASSAIIGIEGELGARGGHRSWPAYRSWPTYCSLSRIFPSRCASLESCAIDHGQGWRPRRGVGNLNPRITLRWPTARRQSKPGRPITSPSTTRRLSTAHDGPRCGGAFAILFSMDGRFDLIISVLAGMAVAGFVLGSYLMHYAHT
jgi:hypothetical protein